MLDVHVILARELVDSHPEDVEVAKDAASGTHQLVAVSVTISGDPDGLEEGVDSGAADCPEGAPKVSPRNAACAIRVEHAAAIHAGKHWARNSPGMFSPALLLGDAELPYRDAHVGAAAHE